MGGVRSLFLIFVGLQEEFGATAAQTALIFGILYSLMGILSKNHSSMILKSRENFDQTKPFFNSGLNEIVIIC